MLTTIRVPFDLVVGNAFQRRTCFHWAIRMRVELRRQKNYSFGNSQRDDEGRSDRYSVGFRRIRTEFQDLGVLYHEAPDAGRPAPPGVEFAEYRVDPSCVLRRQPLVQIFQSPYFAAWDENASACSSWPR